MTEQNKNSKNPTETLNVSSIPNLDNENYKALLDHICDETAQCFNLYDSLRKARNATIIDVIARTSCIACITKKFSEHSVASDVDALHSLGR